MDNINKTLFVVLTCDNYVGTRVDTIKNTWGKDANVIFLADTPINDTIIGYHTPQNYDGIQNKYISFFTRYDFTKYDYYFFVDDDTFVNLKNYDIFNLPTKEYFSLQVTGLLDQNLNDLHGNYTGYPIHKIRGQGTYLPLYHPSGGAGFVLNKNSVIRIQDYLNRTHPMDIPISGHSDVTIAFWMRNCEIEIVNCDKLNYDSPWSLGHDENKMKEALTYHYVSQEKMRYLYDYYN